MAGMPPGLAAQVEPAALAKRQKPERASGSRAPSFSGASMPFCSSWERKAPQKLSPEPVEFSEKLSFVVPGKTLAEILKLLKDSEDVVEISAGQRHILFKIYNYTVISSLLEGEFLNYKATIPSASKTNVTLRSREAIESVERVSLLITDRLKSPVRCTFSGGEIRLLCTTSMGRASDQLSVEMEGEDVEIGFNNRYLLDALKNTECDEIKVGLSGPLSPMTVQPKEGDSFLFLVLPVRLKND